MELQITKLLAAVSPGIGREGGFYGVEEQFFVRFGHRLFLYLFCPIE